MGEIGKFQIGEGAESAGELILAGGETRLKLESEVEFDLRKLSSECILGTLHNMRKVSLYRCNLHQLTNSTRFGMFHYSLELFPHYVLVGDRHLHSSEAVVSRVLFGFEDSGSLFYDFDAFSMLEDPSKVVRKLSHSQNFGRPIPLGSDPIVVYFAGKREISRVETEFGVVRALHNPLTMGGGPAGVQIANRIDVELQLNEGVKFEEAKSRLLRLLRFFELTIGRPQKLLHVRVGIVGLEGELEVNWSIQPSRTHSERILPPPSATRLLLDPIDRPDEFAEVLRNWCQSDEERLQARVRFDSVISHDSYSIDRLVGAANMFDLLPASAVGAPVELPNDVLHAQRESRRLFKALPPSPIREAALRELARLGKPALKRRVLDRAKIVTARAPNRLPEIEAVATEAINCRNLFVHGTPIGFDYNRDFEPAVFLTQTLEFIFAASELIEAGWDIVGFLGSSSSGTHPFTQYAQLYHFKLWELRTRGILAPE